jgi:hypothetical protein
MVVDRAQLETRRPRAWPLVEGRYRMDMSSPDPLAGEFLAGLLLAVSGNGSFELLRSGKELLNRSPVSIIWFGVCAALFEESNVLTTANCVGRRLVRDLQRPPGLFDPPESD